MTAETKKAPAVPHSARNVIIGVITTVVVSGTVYLLGFNKKPSGPSRLERASATTEAWKAYVTVENLYSKNGASIMNESAQFSRAIEIVQAYKKETERFLSGLRDIAARENVDKDMVALLNRRAQNEEMAMPVVEKFYTEADVLIDTFESRGWSEQRFNDSLLVRATKFQESIKGMAERIITDIEDISKTLSERYQQSFSIDDFVVVQAYKNKKDINTILSDDKKQNPVTKENITGKWKANGHLVDLGADGKASWLITANNTEVNGSWEIKNNQLIINIERHPASGKAAVWTFDISNVMASSFIVTEAATPFTSYSLVRR